MIEAVYKQNPEIKDATQRQLFKLNQMFTANMDEVIPNGRDSLKIQSENRVMLYSDLQKKFLFDNTIDKQRLWKAFNNKDYSTVNKILQPWMSQNIDDKGKQIGRDYKDILQLANRNSRLSKYNQNTIKRSAYVRIVNPDHTTVDECTANIGRVFPAEEAPILPTHINCKCKYEQVRRT